MPENKIAIFVEGQSEQIFIRNILFHLVESSALSFDCMKIHGGIDIEAPYTYHAPDPSLYFLIINVENDTRVLSAIKEREEKLFRTGFKTIIGLRDMYSREYRKRAEGSISNEINLQFIESHNSVIQSMSSPKQISFHFAIMEVETWWIGMQTLLEKIHEDLNSKFIQESLGFSLDDINPEDYFFHPATTLKNILELVGLTYDKKRSDVESITTQITEEDIEDLLATGKCSSFKSLHESIEHAIRT